jgi:GABA(A) receptor-associated protein
MSLQLNEGHKIREKFPSRIPVYITRAKNNSTSHALPEIQKNKYLVPCDLTVGQFIYIIRKQLQVNPEMAIFIFVKNNLPTTGMLMKELYAQYGDSDGLLRMQYTSESTFGFSYAFFS